MSHAGDPLTAHQMPHVRRVNTGASWRIEAGKQPADAVLATVAGVHVATTRPDPGPQLF